MRGTGLCSFMTITIFQIAGLPELRLKNGGTIFAEAEAKYDFY